MPLTAGLLVDYLQAIIPQQAWFRCRAMQPSSHYLETGPRINRLWPVQHRFAITDPASRISRLPLTGRERSQDLAGKGLTMTLRRFPPRAIHSPSLRHRPLLLEPLESHCLPSSVVNQTERFRT